MDEAYLVEPGCCDDESPVVVFMAVDDFDADAEAVSELLGSFDERIVPGSCTDDAEARLEAVLELGDPGRSSERGRAVMLA